MSTFADPSPKERRVRGPRAPRPLVRCAVYSLLSLVCIASSAVILSSGRYGLFAPLVQVLLAIIWAALAVAWWKDRKK